MQETETKQPVEDANPDEEILRRIGAAVRRIDQLAELETWTPPASRGFPHSEFHSMIRDLTAVREKVDAILNRVFSAGGPVQGFGSWDGGSTPSYGYGAVSPGLLTVVRELGYALLDLATRQASDRIVA